MNKSASTSSTSPSPPQPPSPITQSLRSTPAIIPLDYNYQTMAPSALMPQSHQHSHQQRHSQQQQHKTHQQNSQHQQQFYQYHQHLHAMRSSIDVDAEQYSSLFGDPVPPPQLDDYLNMPLFQAASVDFSSGDSENFEHSTTTHTPRAATSRLFSDTPFSSVFSGSRRVSNATTSNANFEVLPASASTSAPRLQPPDIQILPNSSGGSSSEPLGSPNYAFLTPDVILRKPDLYDLSQEAGDMNQRTETLSVSDATADSRQYSEAVRRVSNFSEDFKSNVGSFSNANASSIISPAPSKAFTNFQYSNDSHSTNDWFGPATHDFPEFSRMPTLRPSSKNVMSIRRDNLPMNNSPVAAMLNDSNGSSSSGEERLLDTTQTLECPTVCLSALANKRPSDVSFESDLLLTPQSFLVQQQRQCSTTEGLCRNYSAPPPAAPPPCAPLLEENESESKSEESKSWKHDMSPVILKDNIATGGDYRVDEARLHKKTSFTIINDKSSQSSRAQSPSSHSAHRLSPLDQIQTSPSSGRPIAKPRYHLQCKEPSSTQLKLPQLPQHPQHPEYSQQYPHPQHQQQHHHHQQMTSDDSPRPSVQFNMRTGRHVPFVMPQKGILHNRESLTSSLETPLPAALPKRRPSILPPLFDNKKNKSYDPLPTMTDPFRTSIPRLHHSNLDLRSPEPAVFPPGALPRPLKPNPNPTRKQRGLLRIIRSADNLSRIPIPSNWASMDDLSQGKRRKSSTSTISQCNQQRRRSSSTSPSRRSSTQTTTDRRSSNLSSITTSDFSFRRPSILSQTQMQQQKSLAPGTSAQTQRRKSIVPTVGNRMQRTKISKPTTLSPILGTPSKESSSAQSPTRVSAALSGLAGSDTPSDTTSRQNSISKIPVRNEVGSRLSIDSQTDSRRHSRSSSPMKDPSPQSFYFRPSSRAEYSRTPSRTTERSDSRPTSRLQSHTPSRSTSRASTRAISRTASRSSSRPNSRLEQAREIANSRSNSRLSTRSSLRAGSISPSLGGRSGTTPMNRPKSISLSPQGNRRQTMRRQSISPVRKTSLSGRGRKGLLDQRRDSRSRIPTHARVTSSKAGKSISKSPPKSKLPTRSGRDIRRSSSTPNKKPKSNQRQEPASAKKVSSSVRKPESSVKRTPSSVQKVTASAKKVPSNLQRSGSNLQKSNSNLQKTGSNLQKSTSNLQNMGSNLQRTGSNLRREVSNVQKKQATVKAASVSKPVKREPSSVSLKKSGNTAELKTQESSKSLKKTGGAKSSVHEAKTAKASGNGVESSTKAATTTAASDVAGAGIDASKELVKSVTAPSTPRAPSATIAGGNMRRTPSAMSLVRMGSRMSLMSKKRSDSNLSRKNLEQTVLEESTTNGEAASTVHTLTSGQILSGDGASMLPAAILEKSQKTLENIQKTVTVATDEIHKTINENLTDLKSLETDMGQTLDGTASPTPSVATVVENRAAGSTAHGTAAMPGGGGESVSRIGTAEKSTPHKSPSNQDVTGARTGAGSTTTTNAQQQKSTVPSTHPIEAAVSVVQHAADWAASAGTGAGAGASASGGVVGPAKADMADRVSERAISVLPEVDCESANFQNFDVGVDGQPIVATTGAGSERETLAKPGSGTGLGGADAKRRSPDGQGGSTAGSGERTDSQEFLDEKDIEEPQGCCRCCTRFCMPCRRMRCSRCCRCKKSKKRTRDGSAEPVLSATSSATTTNLEVIDERKQKKNQSLHTKTSCWQSLNCCKRCRKQKSTSAAQMTAEGAMEVHAVREERSSAKQNKCGLCLSKILCCRSVNRVEATSVGDETEVRKCCFCIPCRRKRAAGRGSIAGGSSMAGSAAWQDPEHGITASDASVLEGAIPREGCCKQLWGKLLCCRKKPPQHGAGSRRASMRAPPPPKEDTRRKLHVDLVEYNSKMKAAIPVLPLYLAWFCAICNAVFPGLGTLFSGIFCICVGIPRFSHYDSAKARVGSLIINTIVAVSQFCCVLFCFVGWGWSVWWGAIMLRCAKKMRKIKKVERLEMEEERRQAAANAALDDAARTTAANLALEAETAKAS